MKMHVQEAQIFALRNKNENRVSDIVVHLDTAGFIIEASKNAARLGIDLDAQLLLPHIADIAAPEHQSTVTRCLIEVAAGKSHEERIEFPLAQCVDHEKSDERTLLHATDGSRADQEWVLLTLRSNGQDDCKEPRLVGTLRCNGRRHIGSSQRPLEVGSDPFTGLADRRFFARAVTGGIAMGEIQSVALFAIDGMRSIFMQHGQSTADEVRWGFARFLEAMAEPQHILGQVDEERFGVILPAVRPREAREWAADVLATFAGLTGPSKGNNPRLSASAGIGRAEISAEWTIRQAELGLVMARAGGGMQTAICQPQTDLTCGRALEAAIESLVDRTLQRRS